MKTKQMVLGLVFWIIIYVVPTYLVNWWVGLIVFLVAFILTGLYFNAKTGVFGIKVFKMVSFQYVIEGIIFYKSTVLLHKYNTLAGGLFRHSGEAIIVVDKYFFKMSAEAQLFILNHEKSHMTDTYVASWESRADLVKQNMILDNEAKADMYVVSILGRDIVVKGLQELGAFYPEDSLSRKEIDLRINYLQNNCNQ